MTTYEHYRNDADSVIINHGYEDTDLLFSLSDIQATLRNGHYDETHIAYLTTALIEFEKRHNRKVSPVGEL